MNTPCKHPDWAPVHELHVPLGDFHVQEACTSCGKVRTRPDIIPAMKARREQTDRRVPQ